MTILIHVKQGTPAIRASSINDAACFEYLPKLRVLDAAVVEPGINYGASYRLASIPGFGEVYTNDAYERVYYLYVYEEL